MQGILNVSTPIIVLMAMLLALIIAIKANTPEHGMIQIAIIGTTALLTLICSTVKNWLSNEHKILEATKNGIISSLIAISGLILISTVLDIGAIPTQNPTLSDDKKETDTEPLRIPKGLAPENSPKQEQLSEEWMGEAAAWIAIVTGAIITIGTLILICKQTGNLTKNRTKEPEEGEPKKFEILRKDTEGKHSEENGKPQERVTLKDQEDITILLLFYLGWIATSAIAIVFSDNLRIMHSEFWSEISTNMPQLLALMAGIAALIGIIGSVRTKTPVELAAVFISAALGITATIYSTKLSLEVAIGLIFVVLGPLIGITAWEQIKKRKS